MSDKWRKIYIKPEEKGYRGENGAIRAFLYDTDNNEIGNLSESIFHCIPYGDTFLISHSHYFFDGISHSKPSTNNIFVEKIDGEFKTTSFNGWSSIEELNINYDLLDKIIEQ